MICQEEQKGQEDKLKLSAPRHLHWPQSYTCLKQQWELELGVHREHTILPMPKSTILHSSSYEPQKIAVVLPDEKLSAPGGLTQCLFFKIHWPVELHNAHSGRRRTGKQPVQLCQLLPLDQAVKYDFGNH